MYKVVLESFGTLKGKTIEGIALTPAVSLNHNIYSSEAIDNAKNLGVSLPANWEHTEEIVGTVVYSAGPNHSILYKAEITTERANELKEGVHKVSIEANIDEVVESCNRKGCYNLVDGITFEGIGITVNPGVQTTTLSIVESFQDWDIIEKNCKKCENNCVSDCLQAKADKGIEIDDQAKAICFSECETRESEDLSKKIEQLEKQVADLSRPKCTTCGKNKKTEKKKLTFNNNVCPIHNMVNEEEDDGDWITVNGRHILVKNGDKDMAIKQAMNPDEIKKWDSMNKMQRFLILKSKGVKNIDADMYAPQFKDLRFKDRDQAILAMKK